MKNDVYVSHVLFPWETFRAQAEREAREVKDDGTRWSDEFRAEIRVNIERYAALDNRALRNSLLNEVWRMVPVHFRRELFAGVCFPIWDF